MKHKSAVHGARAGLRSKNSPQPKATPILHHPAFWVSVCLAVVGVVLLALRHGQPAISPSTPLSANAQSSLASTRPGTLAELLALSPDQLEKVDLARMNLLCAEGLRGSEKLDVEQMDSRLDAWAAHVESETKRNLHRFTENPKEFEGSLPYYRMMMLSTVLQQDFGTQYNPERAGPQLRGEVEPSERFFADSRDVFIHGLIGEQHVGTCSSMPVLYAAVAQRLGYPVNLAAAKGHLYVRYEDGAAHLNVEATSVGFNTYPDEFYRQWPWPLSEEEVKTYGKLRSQTKAEALGAFLSIRAGVLTSAKHFDDAARAWEQAARYLASTPVLNEIVEHARQRAQGERDADRWDVLWDEVATLALPASPRLAYFRNQRAQLQAFMQQSTDIAAIEKAERKLKEELSSEFKRLGINSDNLAAVVAPEPGTSTLERTVSNDILAAVARVQPPAITIPEARVPPEYRQSLPIGLQENLRGLNNPEHIIAEMWAYYGDELTRKGREATEAQFKGRLEPALNNVPPEWLPDDYRKSMPDDLRSRLSHLNSRALVDSAIYQFRIEQEARRSGEALKQSGQAQSQLVAPPIRIQIIPTVKGEP